MSLHEQGGRMNHIERVTEIWNNLPTVVYQSLQASISPLKRHLESDTTKLARILVGDSEETRTTETETFELELSLLAKLDQGFTPSEVGKWFLVLYRLIKQFNDSKVYDLFLSRIPVVLPPIPSPFRPESIVHANACLKLRAQLIDWVSANEPRNNDELVGAAILSAVLNGGLLEGNILRAWAYALNQPLATVGNLPFFEFRAPFRGMPDTHLQRWFPDPITTMLVLRIKGSETSYFERDSQIWRCLQKVIFACSGLPEHTVTSLAKLIEMSSAMWETQASRVDVLFARRKLRTHSPRTDVFLRFFGCAPAAVPAQSTNPEAAFPVTPAPVTLEETIDEHAELEAVSLLPTWFIKLNAEIATADAFSVTEAAGAIAIDYLDTACVSFYTEWLGFMLAHKSTSDHRYPLDTVKRYFFQVTSALINALGEISPDSCDDDELAVIYSALLLDIPAGPAHTKLARGLREFQHFLHIRSQAENEQQHAPFKSFEDVLGADAELRPVEANVITEEEMLQVREWLGSQRRGSKKFRDAAQVAFSLLRSSAGRRMEFLGCKVSDIHIEHRCVFLIQPHDERGLKTENSKRNIPIEIFLPEPELNDLLAWHQARIEEEKISPTTSQYLFAIPSEGQQKISPDSLSEYIHLALRTVIGDETLHQHIVRHSQGSWIYLALRAKDYPRLRRIFRHLPKTQSLLSRSLRLSIQLTGTGFGPSRTHGFATSRILGHSSPVISWQHYIHFSDLVLHAIAWREVEQILPAKLIRIADIPESTAREALSRDNLEGLVEQAIARAPQRINAMPRLPSIEAPRGRPTVRIKLIPFDTVQSILDAAFREKLSILEIASQVERDPDTVLKLIEIGSKIITELGITYTPTQRKSPLQPYGDKELAFRKRLVPPLEKLATQDIQYLNMALTTYFDHWEKKDLDVAFHGENAKKHARNFLRFILKLGIPKENIRLVVRCNSDDSALSSEHKRDLQALWISNHRMVKPRVKGREVGFRKWIGFDFIDVESKQGMMSVTLSTLAIAKISIEMFVQYGPDK